MYCESNTLGVGLVLCSAEIVILRPLGREREKARLPMTHVLIVDDDADTRKYLKALLLEEGYTVSEAADGHEGLRLMRDAARPLVVLLDYLMPEFNGFDVLRAVHADPGLFQRHSVVIMTSFGRIIPFELARFMTVADIPLLRKPFDIDQVLEAVGDAAERLMSYS